MAELADAHGSGPCEVNSWRFESSYPHQTGLWGEMFKSVGARLLVIILAITITGMGLIAVTGNIMAGSAIIDQTLGRISEATSHDADKVDIWFLKQIRTLESIAADLSTKNDTSAESFLPTLLRHAELNEAYYVVYVGYPDGTAVFSDMWEPDYNEWLAFQRDWYRGAASDPTNVYITDFYQDADTGELCLTFSKALIRNGSIVGVVAVDVFTNVLQDLVKSTDVGEQGYANFTDSDGNIIFHGNVDYMPTIDENGDTLFVNLLDIENGHYAALRSEAVLQDGETIRLRSHDGVERYYTAFQVETTGWVVYSAIPVSVVEAPINTYQMIAVLILAIIVFITVYLIYYSLRNMITHPVTDVTNAANLLAHGEKVSSLSGKYIGEIALLADSFRGMEAFNDQQSEWLGRIAAGDLSIEVSPRGDSDYIGQSIMSMLDNLNDMFYRIYASTHQVAAGSKQIEDGANSLARGSMQQAASTEELFASMTEISEKAKQNTQIADEAANLSQIIRSNAEKGNNQMDQMMLAVEEINEACNSISNIVKTIDEIAFQTQILALNAAVEAARAGRHGKGFTVVADEVRNLARKSAEAAQNTGTLIENMVEKANLGLSMANETSTSLQEIVDGINRSAAIVTQIAQLSLEQTQEISHINGSIESVADVVQQNSATAEQSAAASSEMSSQAEKLEFLISHFKLRN